MIPVLMILLAVVGRVMPHPPNLAPQGAIAVFAGRTLPLWAGVCLTLGAMLLGDLALWGLRGDPILRGDTLFVYAGFAVQVVLGSVLRRHRGGALLAAGTGAVAFFVLSNFGTWLGTDLYPHTAAGLRSAFILALPFFGRTLLGDLLWTVALTLGFQVLARRLQDRGPRWVPVPTTQTAAL